MQVTISYSTQQMSFYLSPFTTKRFNGMATQLMMGETEEKAVKGVLVETESDLVNVIGLTKQSGSSDGFMSLKHRQLGTIYRACTLVPLSGTSGILIVGVHTNTTVIINLSANENASISWEGSTQYNPGETINVNINRREVILVRSDGDLSGSRITADLPIAVYSGNTKTEIKNGEKSHLIEQLLPVGQWGKEFIVPSLSYGTVIVKMVSDNNCSQTLVTKNCTSPNNKETFLLKSVLTFEVRYPDLCYVRSEEPVMVVMFVSMADSNKDPTMTTLPAIENYDDEYVFYAPQTHRNNSALEILLVVAVKNEHKDKIVLSGYPLSDSTTFTHVSNTKFVVGVTTLTSGHHVISADDAFMAIIFGVDEDESYSFPLGMDLENMAEMISSSSITSTVPDCATMASSTTDPAMTSGTDAQTTSSKHYPSDANKMPSDIQTTIPVLPGGITALPDYKTTSTYTTKTTSRASETRASVSTERLTLKQISEESSTGTVLPITTQFVLSTINEPTGTVRNTLTQVTPGDTTSAQNTVQTTEVHPNTMYHLESTKDDIGLTTTAHDHNTHLADSTTESTTPPSTSESPASIAETTLSLQSNMSCPSTCIVCTNGISGVTKFEISTMRLNRKTTSRYLRTLTSACDNRLSAVITGSVGGAILVGLMFGIIALDIDNLVNSFRGRIISRKKHRSANRREKYYETSQC
ncbi:uncharacterized protein [Argopecten irradians]|uniref:uncharacterized protein n=1 Tax=Argopecten irradians TaxID=31199 RepID=UPI0037139B83